MNQPSKLLIMLPSAVGKGIEIQESIKQLSNDIFFISPFQMLFNDFKNYFNFTPTNTGYHEPWISEYMKRICLIQKIVVCQPEQVMASFTQASHIDNTVVALLSMADSFKRMHTFHCGGNVGLCDGLIEHLSEVSLFLNKSSFTSETYPGDLTIPTQVIKYNQCCSRRISQLDCSILIKLNYLQIHVT
jgi:hypothetical protein